MRPLFVSALLVSSLGCDVRTEVPRPRFANGGQLRGATPLAPNAAAALNGMYQVNEGVGRFGSTVAVHASRDAVSVFAGVHDNYALLRSGCLENRTQLVLEGYWRYASTADTGLIRLTVGPPALAAALCAESGPGVTPLPAAALQGATGDGSREPKEPASFAFEKPLIDPQGRFSIVAHHGACGTNDDCSVSENSIPSIRLAEALGANAVEVDVRLTADGVPILFHDPNFGPRLNNGVYCHGDVEQFTLAHLRALCKLRYDEEIPTLEQGLQAVVDTTALAGVWLDVKVPQAIGPTLELMTKYRQYALQKNRNVGIVIGLGEQDVLDAFRGTNVPLGTQCLVELEPNDVRSASCDFWGPRWTRGPMRPEVQALQNEGRAVVYWTIDQAEYIDLFLVDGRPNGIVSGRPALLFHRYQTLGTVPEERSPL